MDHYLYVGLVLLGGLGLAWLLHRRSAGELMPVLKRLAMETNGVVKSQGPFLMPKLVLPYAGTEVEVSSASTGNAGQSTRYTYVLFKGIKWNGFEFRILPSSLQAAVDRWIGLKRPIPMETGVLKEHLRVYANDPQLMESLLSERIQLDLLFWVKGRPANRISDIRNYDDKLIYAVTETLTNYEELKLLVEAAGRFFDAVRRTLSHPPVSGETAP